MEKSTASWGIRCLAVTPLALLIVLPVLYLGAEWMWYLWYRGDGFAALHEWGVSRGLMVKFMLLPLCPFAGAFARFWLHRKTPGERIEQESPGSAEENHEPS